jgi:hypothetical protein
MEEEGPKPRLEMMTDEPSLGVIKSKNEIIPKPFEMLETDQERESRYKNIDSD